jgi:hypothetical protein
LDEKTLSVLWGLVKVVVYLVPLAVLFFTTRNFRIAQKSQFDTFIKQRDEEKRRHKADMQELALETCRTFVRDPDFEAARDRRIQEVARTVVDSEFRVRASSFVDSGVDLERHKSVDARLERVELQLAENVRELGKVSGTLASLTAFLRLKMGFVDSDADRGRGSFGGNLG